MDIQIIVAIFVVMIGALTFVGSFVILFIGEGLRDHSRLIGRLEFLKARGIEADLGFRGMSVNALLEFIKESKKKLMKVMVVALVFLLAGIFTILNSLWHGEGNWDSQLVVGVLTFAVSLGIMVTNILINLWINGKVVELQGRLEALGAHG